MSIRLSLSVSTMVRLSKMGPKMDRRRDQVIILEVNKISNLTTDDKLRLDSIGVLLRDMSY